MSWMICLVSTKLSSATAECEIAAPIPYEGDAHFHVRLFHLQDLYMKKTISEFPIK